MNTVNAEEAFIDGRPMPIESGSKVCWTARCQYARSKRDPVVTIILGTKLVLGSHGCCAGHEIYGAQRKCVQSIMGATENRRDGSGLVATGLVPDFAFISFNVFRTGFGVFRAISASGGCDLATGRRHVANSRGNSTRRGGLLSPLHRPCSRECGRRLVYQEKSRFVRKQVLRMLLARH